VLAKGTKRLTEPLDPAVSCRVADVIASKLDGTPAVANTAARRSQGLSTAIEYAPSNSALFPRTDEAGQAEEGRARQVSGPARCR